MLRRPKLKKQALRPTQPNATQRNPNPIQPNPNQPKQTNDLKLLYQRAPPQTMKELREAKYWFTMIHNSLSLLVFQWSLQQHAPLSPSHCTKWPIRTWNPAQAIADRLAAAWSFSSRSLEQQSLSSRNMSPLRTRKRSSCQENGHVDSTMMVSL